SRAQLMRSRRVFLTERGSPCVRHAAGATYGAHRLRRVISGSSESGSSERPELLFLTLALHNQGWPDFVADSGWRVPEGRPTLRAASWPVRTQSGTPIPRK